MAETAQSEWDAIIARLTPPQRKTLDAMCALEDENDGWHAPIAQIAKRTGFASTGTTLRYVEALAAAGAAQKSPFAGGGYRTARHYTPGAKVS